MASIFGEQPINIAQRQVNPFDLAGPMAAKMKRKLVLREAAKQGLDPNAGEDFYRFTSSRLAQLGDGEGAEIMAQHGLTLRQQEIENRQTNRRQSQFDRGLDLDERQVEINELNALKPTGTKSVQAYDPELGRNVFVTEREALEKGLEPARKKGQAVDVDVHNFPAAVPGKQNIKSMQQSVLDASSKLLRLASIRKNLDTRALTFQGKMKDMGLRFKDFLDVADDADKEEIRKFSDMRTSAIRNLNLTIKALSGAATSKQEIERMKEQEPDPGKKNNPFSGDSQTDFIAKLDAQAQYAEDSIARLNYLLRNMDVFGFSTEEEVREAILNNETGIDTTDPEAMGQIYEQRAQELAGQGVQPQAIKMIMEREFGIPFDD